MNLSRTFYLGFDSEDKHGRPLTLFASNFTNLSKSRFTDDPVSVKGNPDNGERGHVDANTGETLDQSAMKYRHVICRNLYIRLRVF